MSDRLVELLALYERFPFGEHPLWETVISGDLKYPQIIRAEVQHYLRTKAGQDLRRKALNMAEPSAAIFDLLLKTYLEECTQDGSGPSHLELIRRLVVDGGYPENELDTTEMTPGNAAAVALYRDITDRGAGCRMVAAGVIEHQYSELSPKIFEAYTGMYNMSQDQAETYRLHGSMDRSHSQRAFQVLDEVIRVHGWRAVHTSVRDAFVATSLHYDGMLQAATGEIYYWDGKSR